MTRSSALAVASLLVPLYAFGAECTATIDSTDQMTFNLKSISIPKSCSDFTITLNHTGKFPANVMGHNVVLSKVEEMNAIAQDGIAAGPQAGYLKADDPRVLAHTKIIGGGEHTTVTFKTNRLAPDQKYVFFCSFPGHSSMMKGEVIVTQ